MAVSGARLAAPLALLTLLAGASATVAGHPASAGAEAPPGTPTQATPGIVAAANAFLATLSSTQRHQVVFDRDDTAQKQNWSNLPQGLYQRDGLMIGDLTTGQRDAFLAVMKATLSGEGYRRVIQEWTADNELAGDSGGGGGAPPGGPTGSPRPPSPAPSQTGTATPRPAPPSTGTPAPTPTSTGIPSGPPSGPPTGPPGGGGNGPSYGKRYYWVALIGTPSATRTWQWQFGGHHVTVNATISGNDLSLTPSFIGAQPTSYVKGDRTVRPLGDIEDTAFALVQSLDSAQRSAAVLGDTAIDLVLGPGQDCRTIASEGITGAGMTVEQRQTLDRLINRYAGLANAEDAALRKAQLKAELSQTSFAWYGPTATGSAAYFRVTGPHVVIEYSPQSMGGDATNHIHGIYRDPTSDYGGTVCS